MHLIKCDKCGGVKQFAEDPDPEYPGGWKTIRIFFDDDADNMGPGIVFDFCRHCVENFRKNCDNFLNNP